MTDLLTLTPPATERADHPAALLAAPAERPVVAGVHRGGSGVVEVLWHQREIELSGLLHHIRVPLLAGRVPAGLGPELTALLSAWWVDRPSLSSTIPVTSVVADVQGADSGAPELVLLVTTAGLAEDHSIVNVRMIRDLRRALRIHRLGAAAPSGASALAA